MTEPEPGNRLARFLALNRTVAVVLVAVLFFGLGEQLWSPFVPLYFKAQEKELTGDAVTGMELTWTALWIVGLFACLRNVFEGFCYVGGGQITARLGDRGSLLLFGLLATAGYVLFLAVPATWASLLAAVLILGWEPLSVPVTFTTVGASVAASRQGMAFAVQSIQKRLPKIIGPLIAGLVLGASERLLGSTEAGHIAGTRFLVVIALVLGVASLAIQVRWMPHRVPARGGPPAMEVLRQMHPTLRHLLVAEVFTRWCDWLVREFVVLYLVLERQISVEMAGVLFAVQNVVALATYLPIGRWTQTAGLQPFIGLTFVFFALFPLVLALTPDGAWLIIPFVVYGLREIGEPARKALITSLFPEESRARGVGLYWGIRSFCFCTASLVGAALWYWFGPSTLLYAAFAFGGIGAGVFYLFCRVRE